MIKTPVVSGSFYQSDKNVLKKTLEVFFLNCEKKKEQYSKLLGIIAPHAGYMYSGQTAARIYSIAKQYSYKTAIIIAPSHRHNNIDFFVGDYDGYQTPLGILHTDREKIEKLKGHKEFSASRTVDAKEHSLEVQLPFLYYTFPDIKIVPIIFCKQSLQNIKKLSKILREIYTDDTLIIISSDLSHFHNNVFAESKDRLFIDLVEKKDFVGLYDALISRECEACGFGGVLTLLDFLFPFGEVKVDDVFYTHSGQITNDDSSVVGYFSCGFYI
jgi:AmmeMemoRadiSam system protein B